MTLIDPDLADSAPDTMGEDDLEQNAQASLQQLRLRKDRIAGRSPQCTIPAREDAAAVAAASARPPSLPGGQYVLVCRECGHTALIQVR